MKKRLKSILLVLTLILLTSCNKPTEDFPDHFGIPPQPFSVDNSIDEVKKVLYEEKYYEEAIKAKNPTKLSLSEEETAAYEHMISVIKSCDYIYLANCFEEHDVTIGFYPETHGEDMGIRCRCLCDNNSFIYKFAYIKSEVASFESIEDYWLTRFGKTYLSKRKDMIEIVVNNQTLKAYPYMSGENEALAFTYDGFDVRIICRSGTKIDDILDKLNFVKIDITE